MTTPTPADDKPVFSEEVDVFYEFTEPAGGVQGGTDGPQLAAASPGPPVTPAPAPAAG